MQLKNNLTDRTTLFVCNRTVQPPSNCTLISWTESINCATCTVIAIAVIGAITSIQASCANYNIGTDRKEQ